MNITAIFRDTRIAVRLAIAFGLLMALMAGISAYSVKQLLGTTAVLERLSEREWKLLQLSGEWKGAVEVNVLRVATHSRLGTGDFPDQLMKDYAVTAKQIDAMQKSIEDALDPSLKENFARVLSQRQVLDAMAPRIREFRDTGDFVALEGLLGGDFERARKAYLGSIEELQTLAVEHAKTATAQAQADTRNAGFVSVALVSAGLLLAGGFGWSINRAIARPVHGVVQHARRIAAGDLSTTVEVTTGGEAGALQHALADMQQSLRDMVSQVHRATDGISTASAEIANGNQDLSNRTEQAASNLQQAASSMEQLTGTVRQSADAARQANQLASSAAEVAARGGHVVSQVVSTMNEINTSSKKIADIIGVIDGIAFQTNILALNAAVEAARAGEQGRGFAVVASEVRSLAGRSAEAAREIKGLIGASVDKVEAGSRLVANAGQTMTEIVGSVQRVSDIIGEITAASSEQSDGIGQVNRAVSQLDQMTQQNAALVEESAAAAESLRDQAKQLTAVVSVFKLGQA